MKKRIYSFVLIISLLVGSMCGFQGCGKDEAKSTAYITQGEWITLINEAFGMYTYVEETPYYMNIPVGTPYYEQVQIAREWNVIDGSVTEFDTNAYVSYGFAAVTLINASGFVAEEVTAGEKINIAQDMGFIVTDNKNYDIEDNITYNDAVVSLYFAKQQWANLTFDHVVEEVTFAEDVINYIEKDFTDYEIKDGKTYIPADAYIEMEQGDVYALPSNEDNLVASAFVVEEVYREGNHYVVVNSSEDENILEHIETLNIEETYSPDLLACDFYDGNGNLVYQGSEYAQGQRMSQRKEYFAETLLAGAEDGYLRNTSIDSEVSFEFKVGEKKPVTVSGTFTNDSVKFGIDYQFAKNEFKASKKDGNKKNAEIGASVFLEGEIKDIEVTNDIEMSWGKVKYARVSVDYEDSIEMGIKTSGDFTIRRWAPYNNGNGSFLTNLKKALASEGVPGYAKGAEGITGKIKIGEFDLATIGIAKVKLQIYVYVEASGKITVKFVHQGTKGVEYLNGNVRYINTESSTPEVDFNASIEGGINLTLSAELFGICVVAVELKLGLVGEVGLVVHFVDDEYHLIESGSLEDIDVEITQALQECGATISFKDMQQIAESQGGVYEGTMISQEIPLRIDNCLEIKLYFKGSIGISPECTIAKIVKGAVDVKLEVKKDLAIAHIDDFSSISAACILGKDRKVECKKEFTPFAKKETQAANTEEILTYDHDEGEFLDISQYSIELEAGETGHIKVSMIPDGYEITDVEFEVGDESIARVSEDGTVLGLNTGVTYVFVRIPSTQYEMRCAIIVGEENLVPFSPIKDM